MTGLSVDLPITTERLLLRAHRMDDLDELGFAFGRDHQGRGYAAEAARAVLALAFDDLGFHRMSATVVEGNDASVRLLGRLGFRREARHVDGEVFKGSWITVLRFALLEDEWRTPRSV